MRRRSFVQIAAAAGAAPLLPGCYWGDSSAQAARSGGSIGVNLSGMEWPKPGIRRGNSTLPNLHFAVPRKAEIAWLAQNGLRRNRLPILWEMLQPVLHDARPEAATRALVGEPGEFHPLYAQLITDVLDAHAAVGATCVLDLHNYCRYRDFRYGPDGKVPGLKPGQTPLHRPYTEDAAGIQERIFSLAPGATLTQAHFTDFWVRAARRWKDHPGLAGWGLMNEPHDLPAPGKLEESEGGGEDLAIWPAYARAAIEAIRQIDPKTPIYVAGNEWSSAMAMGKRNPGFPLPGANLVYEVHVYLDAASNGHAFDWDAEVRKGFSAGQGGRAIDVDTGVKRLAQAVEWARGRQVRLALGEVGMPPDHPRWQEAFQRTVQYALQNGVEVYGWMAGNHWPIPHHALSLAPGWHQDRTLPPTAYGAMQLAAGVSHPVLVDEAPGWAAPGTPVTVTVQARGHLAAPLALQVSADGARLERTTVTLPAGANPQARFAVTPTGNGIATLRYAAAGGVQVPPPRRVFAIADAVALAADRLPDAAHAILARLGASKWEMAHGFTDYVGGAPAQDGQPVRAVSDSGFGSTVGNAMGLVDIVNRDQPRTGAIGAPVLRAVNGRKALDLSAPNAWGLACRKTAPVPQVHPNPRQRMPFDVQDDHFILACIAAPSAERGGVVAQASRSEERQASELALEGGRPQARWADAAGQKVALAASQALPPGRPVVLTLASTRGAQLLRVGGETVGRSAATLGAGAFDQFLVGWGFTHYYPQDSFGGLVYGVIAGKGRPSEAELAVLERYLLSLAG
jgi:hypothetical protein